MADTVPHSLVPSLVVDSKCELGEGPIWHAGRGELLYLDILAAKVFCFSPEKGLNTAEHDLSANTPIISTIVPVAGSTSEVLVGTKEGVALFDLETKAWQPHPSNVNGEFVRMNDGKCDPQGRFWIGSIGRVGPGGADLAPNAAAFYRLDSWGNELVEMLSGVTVSNGLAWSNDGRTMYYTDSTTFGVDAFDFNEASGEITNRRRIIDVCTSFPPVPDGCALDNEGKLWVACFGAGQVRRYDPKNGALLATVDLPHATAGTESTACAFGGKDLDELYITTAHEFWSAEKQAEMPTAGGLFKVSREELAKLGAKITGVPTNEFKK